MILLLVSLFFTFNVNAFQAYSGTTDLGLFNKIKCSTGVTCTNVLGKLNIVSSPTLVGPLTLESGEIINNTLDDTVEIKSNDENTILQVLGFEAKTAVLNLWADQGDDAADKFSLTAGIDDILLLKNSTNTIQSFSSGGNMGLLGTFSFITNGEILNNTTDDAFEFLSDDNDTTLQVTGFEAKTAVLNLWADQGDDAADKFSLTATIADTLVLKNSTTTLATVDSSGNVLGIGTGNVSGFLQKQVAITTAAITAAQCGSTFVGDSADVIALPEASTVLGCRLTFVAGTADDVDINPADATDVISVITASGGTITPSAGDAIRMTDVGTTVVLEAVGANLWVAISHNGPITDVN